MYNIEQLDSQLINSKSSIRYYLTFPRAAQHVVNIKMELDSPNDIEIFALPNWIPGSYKIRDFVMNQGNLKVQNELNESLNYNWINKNRLQISANKSKKIVLEYIYFSYERTVRLCHVNRFHAFINPANCLMMVEGKTNCIHHVIINNPWTKISTALSKVENDTFGALNYDILIDSPLEIGDHNVYEYELHGSKHEVAIYGEGGFYPDWINEQTKRIVNGGFEMWKKLPYDRYVFIIQLLPNLRGGLEHSKSSVNMFNSNAISDSIGMNKLLSLLVHEYFHLWNVKRIRPLELGSFDYNNEVYTSMLWLCEGFTSYYDDLLTYKAGFRTIDEYFKILNEDHLEKLLNTPGRLVMSVKESSFHAWSKFYNPNQDTHNRFPSYYIKGGTIAWLLDIYILSITNGEKNLDSVMRGLMDNYNLNQSVGITDDDFYNIAENSIGYEIKSLTEAWLNSIDELPINQYLELIGLEWVELVNSNEVTFGNNLIFQNINVNYDFGMDLKDEDSMLIVDKIYDNSLAEINGIGAGDEILAIDNYRVTSTDNFISLIGSKNNDEINLLCSSECRIYNTRIKLKPKKKFILRIKSELSESQNHLFNCWLNR
ncbi:MAG: M61 family metallopeptidase [Chlorobiota bacterium]|nr:M61 family metallopeptidase [Chlorobiota bacterium]QQS65729.1 MAG: M61 family metallopeptidase [Chlorobiota bacterium]